MSSKKRDRDHDRIKVTISWKMSDDSLMNMLASESIETRIREALPKLHETGLRDAPHRVSKLTRTEEGDYKHRHVYRFKYKRRYANTRQAELYRVWSFIIRMHNLSRLLQGDIDFKVEADVQANRLPWVFNNGDRGDNTPLQLGLRPGCVTYKVEGLEPTLVPRSSDSFSKLLGIQPDPDRYATDFMIIGEPRAAWKLYKYYLQRKRGGNLNPEELLHNCLATALPDLVCVLYRCEGVTPEWTLVDCDGPRMNGEYLRQVMTGLPTENSRIFVPDLGLRYEIMEVNKEK